MTVALNATRRTLKMPAVRADWRSIGTSNAREPVLDPQTRDSAKLTHVAGNKHRLQG